MKPKINPLSISKRLFLILLLLLLYTFQINAQTPLTYTKSVTQPDCNAPVQQGAISINVSGGQSPYTYEWSNIVDDIVFSTNSSVSGLALGTYSLKITDANSDFIIDTTQISTSITGYAYPLTSADCPLSNGSASVYIYGGNAPYAYSWSNGSTNAIASGLAGGTTILVQVKDANGCDVLFYGPNNTTTTTGEVKIEMNSSINLNYSTTPEQCPLKNGSIALNPNGGVAPYTYYWNTTPVSNSSSINNLSAGMYTVKVTGADNCYRESQIYVNLNPGTLDVTATKTNDYCNKHIGAASLNITGGVPPYSILWNNGSTATSISGLGMGFYNALVTDQNNCVFNRAIFIDDLSPVSTYISTTTTNCSNNSGSAVSNVIGGTPPYTYQWNTGATTSSISGLSKNYYSVLVHDANGCKASRCAMVDINESCFGYITGKVFQDDNGNCIQDAGEFPILNQWIYTSAANTSPSLYYTHLFTGIPGKYETRYVLPDLYTVNYNDNSRTAPCLPSGKQEINIPVSGVDYPNKDFAMYPNALFEDVTVTPFYICNISEPRPGFDYTYAFSYKNIGTLISNGYLEVTYSDIESFVSSTPAANFYDPATRTLRFDYNALMLGEIRTIKLNFNIPANALLGTTFSHSITANTVGTDPTLLNNVLVKNFTVVGSFDPNDLLVSPKGYISDEDSILYYTIRFQNTGTYPAEFVIIKDTLEANLDIRSISNIVASHNYNFRVLENRAIEFAFMDIHLPDSTRDEEGSHGYVSFSIKRTKDLSPGTEIKNRAEIYFDFNEPIVTNTTVNTIATPTGVETSSIATTIGKVYPNPAKDYTAFRFEKEISEVQLMNASGIVVMRESVNKKKEFELTLTLSKGLYFYKAIDLNGDSYSGKLMIE